MVILLLGFVGAGRTSIGQRLAKKLDAKCIELDELVLACTGYNTIGEVYDKKPSLWKECQIELTKDLSSKENLVIACSGDIVENDLNMQYFRENAKDLCIIYLKAQPEILSQRLINLYEDMNKKGTAKVLSSIKKHYKRRDELYAYYAGITFETDKCTPEESAHELIKLLKDCK